jgi:2-keto-4-pentenoate hydratase
VVSLSVALRTELEHWVDALATAAADTSPIEPLTASNPDLTIEDAYAIQTAGIARRLSEGRVVRGRKAGLTSVAMQQLLGVDEPDFGVLLDDMFVEDGQEVTLDRLLQPRVEAEIGFVLERDLAGPGVLAYDVLRATAGVVACIEVIDSRIADWRIGLVDTVADNASSGLVVPAGRLVPVGDLDLRLVGMAFYRNGELVETGAGAAVLGNPAAAVAWMANKLSEFGDRLRAGELVLAGALHKAVAISPGDVFRAEFDRLGAVTTRFVENRDGE